MLRRQGGSAIHGRPDEVDLCEEIAAPTGQEQIRGRRQQDVDDEGFIMIDDDETEGNAVSFLFLKKVTLLKD